MSIFEYDEEKARRWIRKDAYDDGVEAGKGIGRVAGKVRIIERGSIIWKK